MYRYADDVHINREMREVERWNDPASEFLTVCFLFSFLLHSLVPPLYHTFPSPLVTSKAQLYSLSPLFSKMIREDN